MFRKKTRVPERHPDARAEIQLQRIRGLQASIWRQEQLAAEYRAQMGDARSEQQKAGRSYRSTASNSFGADGYGRAMAAQRQRIADAQGGLIAVEEAITAAHAEIAKLTAELTDFDLKFL